jgi:hypothetical protein
MSWTVADPSGEDPQGAGEDLPYFGLSDAEIAEVINENYNQLRKLTLQAITDNQAHPEKVAAANAMALIGSIYELFRKNNQAVHRQVTEYVEKKIADAQQSP